MKNVKKITSLALTALMVAGVVPTTVFARSTKSDGWYMKSDGKLYYYEYGRKVKYSTRKLEGNLTLLDATGAAVTKKGWVTLDYQYTEYGDKVKLQAKYYVQSDGSVATGWKSLSGKMYFFNYGDGTLCKNHYAYDSLDNKTYCTDSKGVRITKKGWVELSHKYFNATGKIMTEKNKFYLKTGGAVTTGKKTISGKTYIFNDSGILQKNNICYVDGKYYLTDKNGVQVTKKGMHTITIKREMDYGIVKIKGSYKGKVYVNKDGTLAEGLKKISDKYYYFAPAATTCDYEVVGDTIYYFGTDGVCYKQRPAAI